MKCPVCKGTGKTYRASVDLYSRCDECRGTGEIVRTNEEWFCSLPTGEKAHFLSVECARAMCEQQLKITNRNGVDYWKMWLKQPHTKE